MKRFLKPGYFSAWIIPSALIPSPDMVTGATETEKKSNISIVNKETGWDRIKRMFEIDEFGNVSKELVTILHVGAMSVFVGGIYGGTVSSRDAYIDFVKNNQATAFNDHLDAKKKLQDKITLTFGKGAWRWGWRLAFFSCSFTGISTAISVYRGKNGIMEYVAAGAVTGSFYKFGMGPRGWLIGGGLGTVLGLVAGSTSFLLLKLTGMSMDEVRYWNYHWEQDRTESINKGIRKYMDKDDPLLLDHDLKVAESKNKFEFNEKEQKNEK